MDLRVTTSSRLIGPVRADLEAARQDVVRGIANTEAGRQILQQLVQRDVFSPVGKASIVARMYRGPDGLYLGHARAANGEIVANARWVKISTVGSRLLTSAGLLTGHLMLIEMSNKLDRVQAGVDAIKAGLEDDRIQSLQAAIEGVENALGTSISKNRHALMVATIPTLQEAVRRMIAALKREIADIPAPDAWKFNPFKDYQAEVRARLSKAERTFVACLQGISVLSQAYFALDERETGCRSAQRLLHELKDTGISDAEYRTRLLIPTNFEDRPERQWSEFCRLMPELIDLFELEARLPDGQTSELDVELLPAEITEALSRSEASREGSSSVSGTGAPF